MTKQEYYLKLWKRFAQSRGKDYRKLGDEIFLIPSTWGDFDIQEKWKNIIRKQLVSDLYDFICYKSNGTKEISHKELHDAFFNRQLYHTIYGIFYNTYYVGSPEYQKYRDELERDIYNFLRTTQHDEN